MNYHFLQLSRNKIMHQRGNCTIKSNNIQHIHVTRVGNSKSVINRDKKNEKVTNPVLVIPMTISLASLIPEASLYDFNASTGLI